MSSEPRKSPAELREAGQNWGTIANLWRTTVPEVKRMAEREKEEKRKQLADSFRNQTARGFLDECTCHHVRKEHAENSGECLDIDCLCMGFVEL